MTKSQAITRGTTLKKLLREVQTKNQMLPHNNQIEIKQDVIKYGIFDQQRQVIAITAPPDSHSYFEIYIPCKLDGIETRMLQGLHRLVKDWRWQ